MKNEQIMGRITLDYTVDPPRIEGWLDFTQEHLPEDQSAVDLRTLSVLCAPAQGLEQH